MASCWRPNVLVSSMPLTLTVSSVIELMSASDPGSDQRGLSDLADAVRQVHEERQQEEDSAVSRQSMMSIALTVLITITRFEKTLLAVSVTTDCTPPTSFASRLWISPVRVSVKKRSGSFWRCVQRVA